MWIVLLVIVLAIVVGNVVAKVDRNRKAAQTAERLMRYAIVRPDNTRFWVAQLMDDQELAAQLLSEHKQLVARGGSLELTSFPTVFVEEGKVRLEQSGKSYEFRVEGQQLQIIERGSRGGLRETVFNVTALLRVMVGLGLVNESKSGPMRDSAVTRAGV